MTVGFDMVGKLGQLPQGDTIRKQGYDRFHIVAPKECPVLREIEDISKKESRDDLRYGWCGRLNESFVGTGCFGHVVVDFGEIEVSGEFWQHWPRL